MGDIQPDGLIAVLLDTSARWDERDDAASDLAEYTGQAVVDALVHVGQDPTEDDALLDTVGESLAKVLASQAEGASFDPMVLAPAARRAFAAPGSKTND